MLNNYICPYIETSTLFMATRVTSEESLSSYLSFPFITQCAHTIPIHSLYYKVFRDYLANYGETNPLPKGKLILKEIARLYY